MGSEVEWQIIFKPLAWKGDIVIRLLAICHFWLESKHYWQCYVEDGVDSESNESGWGEQRLLTAYLELILKENALKSLCSSNF